MHDLRRRFLDLGYVLVEGGIPPELLARLREAIEPVLAVRGSGTSNDHRHQTLLEARMYRPAFKDFLNLPELNRTAAAMLGTTDLMVCGLAVLLGASRRAVCKWHRDGGDDHDEVAALLEHGGPCVQTNCALYDDEALWIVPGSHRVPTSAAQRAHVAAHADDAAPASPDTPAELAGMPGAMHVRLRAGDCLLYNPFLWHAADYRPERKRATLHGGWSDWAAVQRFRSCRLVLHCNAYLLESDHLGDEGPFLGPQLARYREAVRRFVPQAQLAGAGR